MIGLDAIYGRAVGNGVVHFLESGDERVDRIAYVITGSAGWLPTDWFVYFFSNLLVHY